MLKEFKEFAMRGSVLDMVDRFEELRDERLEGVARDRQPEPRHGREDAGVAGRDERDLPGQVEPAFDSHDEPPGAHVSRRAGAYLRPAGRMGKAGQRERPGGQGRAGDGVNRQQRIRFSRLSE